MIREADEIPFRETQVGEGGERKGAPGGALPSAYLNLRAKGGIERGPGARPGRGRRAAGALASAEGSAAGGGPRGKPPSMFVLTPC